MPEEEKEEFDEELGQKPLRFGMLLNENEKGEAIIGKLQPGSSAFKSGALNSGDKIITVQEPGKTAINVTDITLFQIDSIMNEIKSDKLFLTIKKPDGAIKQTTLYKERFSTEEDEEDKVQGYILKGTKNIGYISIPDFYIDWENTETGIFGCANDVAKEIIKLKKENIEGLIIDIRYNGGGSVQEAIELSGIFIDGGPVAQYKTKEPKVYTLKDVNSGSVFTGAVMILVNGYSASASEMFSATMQDYNRAIVAGSATYGKSTGQLIFPLDTTVTLENYKQNKSQNYIKITTMALYRLTGATAQQQGVVPDILLPDLLETVGEKEKNEQFAFRLLPIEKNKYYKAYNVINTDEIKRTAQALMDTSAYFKKLNDYGRWLSTMMQQKEFSMRIEDVIQFKKKQQSYINFFESFEQQPSFTVANHSLQKERLKASEWLTEMDEETKLMLCNDPYINICYRLLVKVISR
jgi:carboxyl-terminal processing protease